MSDPIDATTLIENDHRNVEQLFSRYEQVTDDGERTRIGHEIVRELAVHGEVEELLFYPRVRQELPDGDALADEAVQEHLEIKETLNALDRTDAGDPEFDARMRELIAEVRHHVQEEESGILPTFREAVSSEDREQLGRLMERAKSVVPTRPHPSAPTGPAVKAAASPPVALIDRVRDAIRAIAE